MQRTKYNFLIKNYQCYVQELYAPQVEPSARQSIVYCPHRKHQLDLLFQSTSPSLIFASAAQCVIFGVWFTFFLIMGYVWKTNTESKLRKKIQCDLICRTLISTLNLVVYYGICTATHLYYFIQQLTSPADSSNPKSLYTVHKWRDVTKYAFVYWRSAQCLIRRQ